MIDLAEKQNIARENGRKSKGPVSEAGKRRSSLNGITHGLASKCVVLVNESEDAYTTLLTSYQTEWLPTTPTEQHLVMQMTNSYWRLRRIWTMETALFDAEMLSEKDTFDAGWSHHHPGMRVMEALTKIEIQNPATLDTLHRYETRYNRIYKGSMDQILKLRRRRKAPGAFEPPDSPLPDPHESQYETDPKDLGDQFTPQDPQAPPPCSEPQPAASTPWLTRFLAVTLSLLAALLPTLSPAKRSKQRRNTVSRTSEPTLILELPVFNFTLPEIFLWLSLYIATPAAPEAEPAPRQTEKPDART